MQNYIDQSKPKRTILGSLYYIAQGSLKSSLYPYLINECGLSENKAPFCLGMAAGSISGASKSLRCTYSMKIIYFGGWIALAIFRSLTILFLSVTRLG